MYMFESLLNSIPKNRSEYVEDLEIPDITLSPVTWREAEDSISVKSDSSVSGCGSMEEFELERGTISTDSSIPLSRAMTDSDLDYGRYKRYKNMNYSDPWDYIRAAVDAFPPDYLTSLNSFISTDTADEIADAYEPVYRPYFDEVWKRRMRRHFLEDCCVFTPDDPGLPDLQDAMRSLEMKDLEADLESITVKPALPQIRTYL